MFNDSGLVAMVGSSGGLGLGCSGLLLGHRCVGSFNVAIALHASTQ